MRVIDLQRMAYRDAWTAQEQAHERVRDGGEETVFIVEHPPVITLGRRPGQAAHVVADEATLRSRGVEIVASDRGGDVTYHGPGQLVVYPIMRLADHGLSVSGYVHRLEAVVIETLAQLGVRGDADPAAPGVWVLQDGVRAKVCAVGVRIRRGVTMHGIALNVTTDLDFFDLIIPCGLAGRAVTSLARLLGREVPTFDAVKQALIRQFRDHFDASRSVTGSV